LEIIGSTNLSTERYTTEPDVRLDGHAPPETPRKANVKQETTLKASEGQTRMEKGRSPLTANAVK
jgi:hypothetical protein